MTDEQFSNPRARGIEVMLRPGRGESDLRAALLSSLAASEFMLRRVPLEPTGLAWDVMLLKPLPPGAVWDLARQFQADPAVQDAEPSFEVTYAEEREPEKTTESVFKSVPRETLHGRVAQVFGIKASAVDALETQHGRELRFWALTQPSMRKTLLGETTTEEVLSAAPKVSQGLQAALDLAK